MADRDVEQLAADLVMGDKVGGDTTTIGTSGELTTTSKRVNVPSSTASITAAGGITVTRSHMRVQGDGGAIDITANPQIAAGVDGEVVMIEGMSESNTVRLETGNGLHLHGGSITLGEHDLIILTYDSGDSEWQEISREPVISEKSWRFSSPSGGGGTFYVGGHYELVSGDNDFNPAVTSLGTAGKAEGAHVFFVAAAGATDTEITVTGISITDGGVRNASDSEVVLIDNASADTYYETAKKWLGSPSIEKTAGTDRLLNYGWCKYYDRNNSDFRVIGLEATWLGGANDAAVEMKVYHHKSTGWTYNNAAAATPPTPVAVFSDDYSTDIGVRTDENGAWKRDNLSENVTGTGSEGIIIEMTTTAAKTFQGGTFNLVLRPN